MTTKPIIIENGQVRFTLRPTEYGSRKAKLPVCSEYSLLPYAQISERFSKAAFCTKTALSAAPAAEMETSLSGTISK